MFLFCLGLAFGALFGTLTTDYVLRRRFEATRERLSKLCGRLQQLEDEPEQPRCPCAACRDSYEQECG